MTSFEDAPCRRTDPELFFPGLGESPKQAKQICETCDPEIKAACLALALAENREYGVWGGLTEMERRRFKKTRRAA